MSILQRLLLASVLISVSYAGVMEKRQAAETFATCTPAYNSRFCPDPYCVCTQSTTSTISGTITSDSIVNVYAATSGAPVCPTAGAAVSEAGCQIVVESKTDSTCGTVVFNTDFCLPSSMASTSSSSTPIQISSASQALRQEYQPVATTTAQAPVITPGPSYKILSGSTCVSNGVTLSPTLTPEQTCGSLTALPNCIPFAVLPYNIFNAQSASFTGCACTDSWQFPSLTSLQIYQGGQTQCNPSYSNKGPWVEVSAIANTPGFYDIVPDCTKWLGDNTANPTPGNNPCRGAPYTETYTASCSTVLQVDALGQADDECSCSNTSPKYKTEWFGDCPSADYVTFTQTSTIG